MRRASYAGALVLAAMAAAAGCEDDVNDRSDTSNGGTSAGGDLGGGGAGAQGGGGSGANGGHGGQGGQGGDAGAGGMSMGAPLACQECVAEVYSTDLDCAAALQDCIDDTACNAWKECSQGCFDNNDTTTCYAACDTAYPHDPDLGGAVRDCTCDTCDTVCVNSCRSA